MYANVYFFRSAVIPSVSELDCSVYCYTSVRTATASTKIQANPNDNDPMSAEHKILCAADVWQALATITTNEKEEMLTDLR